MPAWLSSGMRQRTKRIWKGASEGDTRIDDSSDSSPLTIEIGSDSPLGITNHDFAALRWASVNHSRMDSVKPGSTSPPLSS
jgi:hypothetical protein